MCKILRTNVYVYLMYNVNKYRFNYRKLVGNKSTMTQYTVLMPRDVNASKMHERTRFCVESMTK